MVMVPGVIIPHNMVKEVQEVLERFFPVRCPTCDRIIGEIQSGVSRYNCSHCKRKVRVRLMVSERIPIGVIYLLIEREPLSSSD